MVDIILSKRALVELDKIYDRYEKSQLGLGDKFLNKLYKKYTQIGSFPKTGNVKKRTYRETYLEVFPFAVIYRIILKKMKFLSHLFLF